MSATFDILIVDDEPVVTGAAKKILASEGYTLDLAADGGSCLGKVQTNRYRVVLCDLMLPGVQGFELVAELKRYQPGVPVVLISGYATLENAVGGFKNGVFDFIPKPFDVGELLGVTQRALEFAAGTAELERQGLDRWLHDRAEAGSGATQAYTLGRHAWAVVDAEGQAQVGLGETFAAVAGKLHEVRLPEFGEDLLQGNTCIRMVTHDQLVHRLWAPLSGRVIATNRDAAQALKSDAPVAICRNWLITMLPSDLGYEASQLTCP